MARSRGVREVRASSATSASRSRSWRAWRSPPQAAVVSGRERGPPPAIQIRGAAVDLMSWNVAGSRLAQAMAAMPSRPGLVLLQEVRVPRGTTWSSSHGYTTLYSEPIPTESGVSLLVRNDIMKKWQVSVEVMDRHYSEIKMKQGTVVKRIAVLSVPPEGSRHYKAERMQERSRSRGHRGRRGMRRRGEMGRGGRHVHAGSAALGPRSAQAPRRSERSEVQSVARQLRKRLQRVWADRAAPGGWVAWALGWSGKRPASCGTHALGSDLRKRRLV